MTRNLLMFAAALTALSALSGTEPWHDVFAADLSKADYDPAIWHRDADLCLIDLQQGQEIPLESWNSHDTDSYHSWSSNSRWVVFSSRRSDGLYTRPFLAYVGPEGELGKPFLLPQRHTNDYQLLMKSFNVPELIRGKVSPKHLGVVSEKK